MRRIPRQGSAGPAWGVRYPIGWRFLSVEGEPVSFEEEMIQLAIPLDQAVAFAMGWTDLDYSEPNPVMRRIIGELALEGLQYSEQWREAAMLSHYLRERWPNDVT